MNPEQIRARVASFSFWYHKIDLPGGVSTPGLNPVFPPAYGIPERLDGLRVLDVGAWDGYWTFEALRRGARQVVAIDDFSDYLGHLKPQDRKAWQTFDFCREALGYGDDRCTRREISVYDLRPDTFGTFDVVFFFGTLYHLRHPLLALDRIAAACTGQIFVETTILNDYSPYLGGLGKGYPEDHHVVMEFYPTNEYANNVTNWWNPTLRCLMAMVWAAGFTKDLSGWKLADKPQQIGHCRGFARGRKP
ncbi:MAG: DUF1698 domain-containing protein [Phycisphaerales bacterium]